MKLNKTLNNPTSEFRCEEVLLYITCGTVNYTGDHELLVEFVCPYETDFPSLWVKGGGGGLEGGE